VRDQTFEQVAPTLPAERAGERRLVRERRPGEAEHHAVPRVAVDEQAEGARLAGPDPEGHRPAHAPKPGEGVLETRPVAEPGGLSLPALLGATFALGVLGALNGPAWQATVPRQVPDHEVPAAVALMSTGFNLARALGPAAGAWMLVQLGPAAAFFTNALSYTLIGALIWRMPAQPPQVYIGPRASPLKDPPLRRLYAVVLFFGLFAMPSLSLLPVVARDALQGDARVYGHLLSAFGLGAVSAGLTVAAGARRFGNRPFIVLTTLVSAVGFWVLAHATVQSGALIGAATCGAGWIGTISTVNAAVQMRATPEVRARALAFYLSFAVGGQATGSFVGGWLASRVGIGTALECFAVAQLGLAMVVAAGYRGVSRPRAS
jgi:predicted MFS family arabinose efflux permease